MPTKPIVQPPTTIKFHGATYEIERPRVIKFKGATYVLADVDRDEIEVPQALKKFKKKTMREIQTLADESIGFRGEIERAANRALMRKTGLRELIDKFVSLDSWSKESSKQARAIIENFNKNIAEALAKSELSVDYLNILIDIADQYGLVDRSTLRQYRDQYRQEGLSNRNVLKNSDEYPGSYSVLEELS